MRTVLKNNSEVAHFWANQSQSEGRAFSMNFRDSVIFSYGEHWELGKIMTDAKGEKVVFLQSDTCSSSTGKHASIVRHAISHLPSFYVKNSGRSAFSSRNAAICTDHLENVRFFIDGIDKRKGELKHGRTGLEWYLQGITENVGRVLDYVTRFKVPVSKLDKAYKAKFQLFKNNPEKPYDKTDLENIAKFEAREKKKTDRENQIKNGKGPLFDEYRKGVAAREKQKENKLHAEALIVDAQRKAWLDGENVSYPLTGWNEPHKLRIKGLRIETTGHAEISLNMANKFWKRFKVGSDISGFDFGPYKARDEKAVENGLLVVGCHRIPVAELHRIAGLLGWQ